MKALMLAFVLALLGCGDDDSSSQGSPESALAETIGTKLKGYTILTNSTNSCSATTCTTSFTATENCPFGTLAFVKITSETAYLQKIEEVFIRQGEPHEFTFETSPTEVRATGYADGMSSYVYCRGQNG